MVRLVVKFEIGSEHSRVRQDKLISPISQTHIPLSVCSGLTGLLVSGILAVSVSLMSKLDVKLGSHVSEAAVQAQRTMTFLEHVMLDDWTDHERVHEESESSFKHWQAKKDLPASRSSRRKTFRMIRTAHRKSTNRGPPHLSVSSRT